MSGWLSGDALQAFAGSVSETRSSGKARILELLDVMGDWTQKTFDLVMASQPVPPLTEDNVQNYLQDISVVEVKSPKAANRNCGLSGFFFGSTERQYLLAAALGDRFGHAFVVLNSNNDYGRPVSLRERPGSSTRKW